ncbi:hypothetical protein [Deinococcus yavapaiensis]|uniref:hypothetical protein n=1 Tax=Deinococcus yavapaiensis TaxID=309889 RepID=UPI0011B7CCAF|nr:hypothetical protein [Deinococcus yavapaiensis]
MSALRDTLATLGMNAKHLSVLEGSMGIRQLNSRGHRGGLLVRLVRNAQGMTDEQREITKYREALQREHLVVLVDMPRDDHRVKEQLRQAFQQAGASSIDYFGTFVNEQLTR